MNEEARVDPAPGSDEARERGCTCPRYDNRHGDGHAFDRATGAPMFVVREDCPLHGTATQEESTDEQS